MQLARDSVPQFRPFTTSLTLSNLPHRARGRTFRVIKRSRTGGCPTRLTACLAQTPSEVDSLKMNEENYQVLQPVKVVSRGLVTYTGDNILTGCFSTASVTDKDADGILLGFETSEGPVAIQDFSLGQVCH